MQSPARPPTVRRLFRRASAEARAAALRFRNRRVFDVIAGVRSEHLTYSEPAALLDLADRVFELERRDSAGIVIEAGCAYGGSAILLTAAKRPSRPLDVYDVFGAFPPPSERDERDAHQRYAVMASGEATWPGGEPFYGYVDDLQERVAASFARHGVPVDANNVRLVKGLYEETLAVDRPVALAHIDCDWYDSVRVCLERIAPMLEPGGVLVIDDYDDWAGCRKAVDDYFRGREGYRFERRARLHVMRGS